MTDGNLTGSNGTGIEVSLLEKRLEGIRDTQECIEGLSLWCQAHKKYSTPIIDTWLRVLRRSPVEKRLTMFYLANDVVQHAKRKGDLTVVNQWAVAVQKATPHVRSPSSVSTAIVRIFKIWEERSIYSKETIADLISLISKHNSSTKERTPENKKRPEIYTVRDEKVKAFQSSELTSTIKQAFRLKSHLGVTFRTKQYVNMNMEQLIASIKDRQHGTSVIENVSELLDCCCVSANKLVHEVEERRKIVEAAEVAIVFFENIRAEAAIVSNAYKSFTERVVKTKAKVDEMMKAFARNMIVEFLEMEGSPVPSPERLSPYDEVQILLPPIAEFEARQAQTSNLIELQPTSKLSVPDGNLTAFSSQYSLNNILSVAATPYDLVAASQWPTYSLQLQQLMQQQIAVAQEYAAVASYGTPSIDSSHLQNQPEVRIIPTLIPKQTTTTSNQETPASVPLPSNTGIAIDDQEHLPYDPSDNIGDAYDLSSSASTSFDNNDSYLGEDDDGGIVDMDYSMEEYHPNSTSSNSTEHHQRYHPYNNSNLQSRDRRLSEGTTMSPPRPPRPTHTPRLVSTPANSGTPSFIRPPAFNPRNPNTIPLRPRVPFSSNPGESRMLSPTPRPPGSLRGKLMRLAQCEVNERPVSDISYNYAEDPEGMNGADDEDEVYESPQLPHLFSRARAPGIAQTRPRMRVPPLMMARGVGPGRGRAGNFVTPNPVFRGTRTRGTPTQRRGSYYIL